MSLASWMQQRRSTLISIAVGTLSWPLVLWITWTAWPDVAPLEAAGDRLAYAAQLLVAVAVLVLLMVSACFRTFDTPGAEDPMAGAESPAWKVHQRVLQNTVEQSLIFVPALLALSARLPADDLRMLPVLTTVWCAGRVLFWLGYRIKPALRGPGFEWTLFTSVFTLGWFGYLTLR